MRNEINSGLGIAAFRIGLAFLLVGSILGAVRSAHADGIVRGHVLARLNDTNEVGDVDDDYGTTDEDYVASTGLFSLRTPDGVTETDFVGQLSKDSRVAWAETDTYVNPPEVTAEPFHFAFDAGPKPGNYTNQKALTQVHLGTAHQLAKGKGVIVAVLDTGATFSHPALKAHYLKGYNALDPTLPPNDVADGLTNGAVGHGTMIAGILAAIAPGARIMPVRVLNGDGIGTILDVVKGIDYAVNHGSTVLNMSFGTSRRTRALDEALNDANDAGVVIVASAGNNDDTKPHFPVASDNILAVTSVEANDIKSTYSNYGDFVSVVAPGTGIRSTYYTGGYANWSGTSFATPFITAEATLLLSKHPMLSTDQLQSIICGTAHSVDGLNPQYEEMLGTGIIDIEAAVKSAP